MHTYNEVDCSLRLQYIDRGHGMVVRATNQNTDTMLSCLPLPQPRSNSGDLTPFCILLVPAAAYAVIPVAESKS
jgi:hypothetical protein